MRKIISYKISDIAPYINWPYFYYAWQMKDREGKVKLKREAEDVLERLEGQYHTHGLFVLEDANSDDDDIVLADGTRIPLLRQQANAPGKPSLCLADFIRPLSTGKKDKVGVFATTVDIGLETDFDNDDYMKMMVQLLADRLAEATAEKLHEEVRKKYWGYAPDEHLTIPEMLVEKYQGIRPAVGYPSIPDSSINFVLSDILGMKEIGIRLTETGAMKPHASVSGLMISHPASHYFALGKIGEDQLRDYAGRRGLPLEMMRKFLNASLR